MLNKKFLLNNGLMKNGTAVLQVRNITAKAELKSTDDIEETTKKRNTHYDNALPFENIPSPSKFKLLRYVLPGGKWYNVPRQTINKMMFTEFGHILRIPGVFGRNDFILTINPEDFETIFRTESVWPFRAPLDTIYHYRKERNPEPFTVGGLMVEQDEEWGRFRSIVNPILMQPRTIKMYIPKMDVVANDFLKRIYNIRDPTTLEVPGTFINDISNWTLESVCVVALDTSLGLINDSEKNADARLLVSTVNKFFKCVEELDLKPSVWKWIATPKYYEHMKVLDTLTNLSTKYINAAIVNYANIDSTNDKRNDSEKSILERLLKIDKKVAVVMAMDLIMAGVDTTSSAFTSCLLCLAQNPEKQEILRKEIMAILPEKDSPLTVENMNELPYLRACIKEGLRVFPVAAGSARRTKQDIVLSGYKIPTGTDVAAMAGNLYDQEDYFASAMKFLPERWLRHETETKTGCPFDGKPSNPFVYIPFGFGARSCVGRRLVNLELEIAIARIIRHFKVEFNHPLDNMFQTTIISSPVGELKFKFTDL